MAYPILPEPIEQVLRDLFELRERAIAAEEYALGAAIEAVILARRTHHHVSFTAWTQAFAAMQANAYAPVAAIVTAMPQLIAREDLGEDLPWEEPKNQPPSYLDALSGRRTMDECAAELRAAEQLRQSVAGSSNNGGHVTSGKDGSSKSSEGHKNS